MNRDSTTLLIVFGFVLGGLVGFTLGMIATPYLVEIKTLENGSKVPALIEGYGDIWGGLLSAIVAFVAAYFVWWIQHRKEEQERSDEKAFLAEKMLKPVEDFLGYAEMMVEHRDESESDSEFLTVMKKLNDVWARLIDQMNACPPDRLLGLRIGRYHASVISHGGGLVRRLDELHIDGDMPDIIAQNVMTDLKLLKIMLTMLVRDLDKLTPTRRPRPARKPKPE